MSLSQLLAKHILTFDHRTRYISIQTDPVLLLLPTRTACTSLLFYHHDSASHQPTVPPSSVRQDHSSLTAQLPQAKGWNVCFAYFICFLFLKNQICLLFFIKGLKITAPYILSRFIDVFNAHEVSSSRGSQVPSSMLGLEENSSKGHISNEC